MHFFTSAARHHTLQFKRLSEFEENKEEYLKLAASWARQAWGYLHKNEKKYYFREVLLNQDQIYVATFNEQPVGMFGLFEKRFDSFRDHSAEGDTTSRKLKVVYFDYIFVEENARGLGFAGKLLNKAKSLAVEHGADLIYLDTLNPRLNKMYMKLGAKVICEGQYMENPTDVLSIKL
ncbi:GNAT family N-acetyltransferase [Fluoribacter dumoffii]|uniref:GNAT family N-acetyltransferase n=1 Tax=Fluoribacter dumoffii TaxID=463 RepID=UPI002243C8D6|nr:GNAT family N-acetyltransferase [Fluoribacter dumoffii]MCW8386958.1 GNAT family N-acetyltransferase [Fluoribacter dumoffii]MCW8497160.1 GNAT family N-acetyltransferase [Fluoribacter dumoffii]